MGASRRYDAQPGLEARMRIPPLWLGGLQRGDRALRASAWVADPSDRRLLLPWVDGDLPMGKSVRLRFSLWRPAIHPPVLARMDRFSRDQGPLHARKALRLFREQPACDAHPARIRPAQPERIRGLRWTLLGSHRV